MTSQDMVSQEKKSHIFICGVHSSGKTTLINKLKEYECFKGMGLNVIGEVARTIMKENGYTQETLKDIDKFHKFNLTILKRLSYELDQIESKGTFNDTLWDRGFICALTYLYTEVGEKSCHDALELPHVQRMLKRWQNKTQVLVMVIPPNRKFLKDDGVRLRIDNFKKLQQFHCNMTSLLDQHKISYVTIEAEDLDERVKFMIKTIEQWRANV